MTDTRVIRMHDRSIIVKSCRERLLNNDDFGSCRASINILTIANWNKISEECPLENTYDQPMQTNKLWGNDQMHIIVRKDGEAWFAHDETFTDLQESEAEFGDTPEEAASLFIINHKKSKTCGRCGNKLVLIDSGTFVCNELIQGETVVVTSKRPACDKWIMQVVKERS